MTQPHAVLLELDFLQHQSRLRLTRGDGATFVFDPLRRKNLVLTPEEALRQLTLLYLLETKRYPANRIRAEVSHSFNGQPRRCDLLVFDAGLQPWLLVECKSPRVRLTQATFEQAARYNLNWKAPYLAITNGPATICCAIDHGNGSFTYLSDFPDY